MGDMAMQVRRFATKAAPWVVLLIVCIVVRVNAPFDLLDDQRRVDDAYGRVSRSWGTTQALENLDMLISLLQELGSSTYQADLEKLTSARADLERPESGLSDVVAFQDKLENASGCLSSETTCWEVALWFVRRDFPVWGGAAALIAILTLSWGLYKSISGDQEDCDD